jgi:hypothetical protein
MVSSRLHPLTSDANLQMELLSAAVTKASVQVSQPDCTQVTSGVVTLGSFGVRGFVCASSAKALTLFLRSFPSALLQVPHLDSIYGRSKRSWTPSQMPDRATLKTSRSETFTLTATTGSPVAHPYPAVPCMIKPVRFDDQDQQKPAPFATCLISPLVLLPPPLLANHSAGANRLQRCAILRPPAKNHLLLPRPGVEVGLQPAQHHVAWGASSEVGAREASRPTLHWPSRAGGHIDAEGQSQSRVRVRVRRSRNKRRKRCLPSRPSRSRRGTHAAREVGGIAWDASGILSWARVERGRRRELECCKIEEARGVG